MCLSMRPTSKWHFVSGLWGPITLCADLRLKWVLKQSCNPHWQLSNGMLHTTYTQGNHVDSQLLVVGSQIVNLIPDLSFGHNLCFKCSNGSCEFILNIYVSITFQWCEKLFNPMGFDHYNHCLKIQESIGTPTPKMGVHLGVWGIIPSHSFCILGLPSWPITLQALTLVTSPRLGLQQLNLARNVRRHIHST
jgi:hypothetical protein